MKFGLGHFRRQTLASVSALVAAGALSTACQSSEPSSQPTISEGSVPVTSGDEAAPAVQTLSFEEWLAQFQAQALNRGISQATLDAAFAGVAPNQRIIELDSDQPEFSRQIWEYLDSAVSATRISNGQTKFAENRAALDQISAQFGVPPQVLVAIWGIESGFGANFGSFRVVESLATLAYDSRRTDFGEEQLMAALQILEAGDIEPGNMLGSWAGAMGHTQFIPTAFLRYAVDFDLDGRRDIWGSIPDALASTASHLATNGWVRGETWGREVRLPDGFDWALADGEGRRTLADWSTLGVMAADGTPLPASGTQAALIVPAGHRGPGFLIYENFQVIKAYNNATAYALAVAHLADRIAGGGPFVGAWPRDVAALSRQERFDLQTLLTAQGYDPGTVDGIIGPNTRSALRAFQAAQGVPADGFPTQEMLALLRAANES